MTDRLLAPFRLFMRVPWLAFAPAAILLGVGWLDRSHAPRLVVWAGVAWVVYALWESAVWFWARSPSARGGTPIRVDLLLIVPVLYGLTSIALILWARAAMA